MAEPRKVRRDHDQAMEMELQLQALADNLPGGMVYQIDTGIDGSERRLTYISRGVESLHEVALDSVTEDSSFIYRSMDPGDLADVARLEAVAIRTMTPFSADARVTLPSGTKAWRHFISAPRRQADGRLIWDGIEVDITARKQAEEQQRLLQEQLSQAQKIDSIGQLAGGIAHDFNNMLAVILGHAEMALGRMALEHVGRESPIYADLMSIRTAAERSADLTRQLLAFARKQAASPRVLDLNETISGTIAILERLIGEGIELSWNPGDDVAPVMMDPTQIDQILVNLCVNARDAISGRGRINIETGSVDVDAAYCRSNPGFVPGSFTVMTVSDDGCGMDAPTLERVFEPFFTTKEVGKGTGLGLPMVYGIVKQNGGFIRISSEPGRGATFQIFLPRSERAIIPVPTEAAAVSAGGGSETVLLVEDEPLIRDLTGMMLDSLGYTAIVAASPVEAIRMARRHKGRIHLLLTDVVMPEMSGRELATAILAIQPGIRLLFTSGYTADLIDCQGLLDSGIRFLPKPFAVEDLARKIREALDC